MTKAKTAKTPWMPTPCHTKWFKPAPKPTTDKPTYPAKPTFDEYMAMVKGYGGKATD